MKGPSARWVFLACWLLALRAAAAADDTVFAHPIQGKTLIATLLAEPSRAMARAQVLQGRFTHRKYLSEIPQPLTATGTFTFARGLGVEWHTLQPFDSVFVLSEQGISQRDDGVETLRLSADDQPAVRVIGRLFFALFTLDVATLESGFDLYARPQGKRWEIGLRPKSAAVGAVFSQAWVSGAADVEQVTLTDAHGDRTVIDLSALAYSAEPPTVAVRALFKR
jgi:hypothetical protein